MKQTELKQKPASRTFVRKMFFSVVYVMMLTAIISTIVVIIQGVCVQNFMDNPEIGCSGKLATEADQLSVPIFSFGTFFCYTFGFGLQILVSRYINTPKKDEISQFFTASMILNLCVIIVFLLIAFLLSTQIARLLGADDLHVEYTAESIKGFFCGFCFHSIFRCIHPSMYLKEMKVYAYVSTAAMVAVTVLMFLLVSFYCPVGPEKMFWFGFCTTAPYIGGIFVFIIYFIVERKTNIFKLKFKGLKGYHFGQLFVCGAPTGLRKLSLALYILVLNIIVVAIDGEEGGALAASGVQMHYQTLLVVFSSGIYYSGAVMSSYFRNLGDREYYQEYLRFITLVCSTFMVGVALIFVGLAGPLTWLYGAEGIEYKYSVIAIRWYSLALPFITFSGVWLSVYQGSSNWKWMYPSILWQDFFPLVFVAACGFIGKSFSDDGGRYGIFVGEFIGAGMVIVVHFFLGWIINKGKPFSAEAQYFLDKKTLHPKDKVLRSNLNNKNDWIKIQFKLDEFGKRNKISNKNLDKIKQFIDDINERVTKVVVPNKKYAADVRVVKTKNQILINWTDSIKAKKIKNKDTYSIAVDSLKSVYPNLMFSDSLNVNEFSLNIK